MKRNAFTLIELLAVIAILGVFAILIVPNVLSMYEKARIEAFKTSVKSMAKSIDNYIFTNELDTFPSEGINISD